MKAITEVREIPVRGAYDTIVCGGGVAGIAAALSAARCGAKTLLLEREYMLGGLATAGLVTIYLPICDGLGHQVSFGLAEELLKLSIRYGYEDRFPEAWLNEKELQKQVSGLAASEDQAERKTVNQAAPNEDKERAVFESMIYEENREKPAADSEVSEVKRERLAADPEASDENQERLAADSEASEVSRGRLAADSKVSEEILEKRKKDRYQVQFNAQLFAIAAEQELIKAGVEILYGTQVSDVVMDSPTAEANGRTIELSAADTEDTAVERLAADACDAAHISVVPGPRSCHTARSTGRITALIAENKTGRFALEVKTVVDATGDADICKFSGAPVVHFEQGNVLAAWYYSFGKDAYKLRTLGACDIPDEEKTEKMKREDRRERFPGLTGEELTDQMIKSHEMLLQDVLKHRETDESYLPVTMATTPQVRMTRRIDGESTMRTSDDRKDVPDSVGIISNWKKRGPVYEVPLSALYSSQVKNLITAGRCISADEAMWDVTRVIPCCAVTGQAAGTAAALCAGAGGLGSGFSDYGGSGSGSFCTGNSCTVDVGYARSDNGGPAFGDSITEGSDAESTIGLDADFASLDVRLVQQKLREDGVVIKIQELGI